MSSVFWDGVRLIVLHGSNSMRKLIQPADRETRVTAGIAEKPCITMGRTPEEWAG